METYPIHMSDGKTVFCRKWLPEPGSKPVAVVQIAHGMAEHSGRYDWFAKQLCGKGMVVHAHDHRGHGLTESQSGHYGFFAESKGWDRAVTDIKELGDLIRKDYHGLPFFLFGHSMGSFLVRDCLERFPGDYTGVVISGTAGPPGLLGFLALAVARLGLLFNGPRKPNALMDILFMGGYANAFKPIRTPMDWLSRDPDQVDAYIHDPMCGFICSSRFYADLVSGIIKVNSHKHISKTPADLPMTIFSGSMDPVGNFSKGVLTVHGAYRDAGVKDISVKLYEGGRHEMLNETNRDEVAHDVIQWIMSRVSYSG